MSQQIYVVLDQSTGLYLTSYSYDPEACGWGNSNNAVTFSTLAAANEIAASIGGGTVGTTKP